MAEITDPNKRAELSSAERRMIQYFRIRPDRAAEILLGIEMLPFQRLALLIAWNFPFSLFVLTRGAGKTFMLALLSVLRAVLYSNQRVGLIAASYRQSKMIFAEIERIYNKAPILQSMSIKPPVRGTDMCYFNLNNGSEIQALPLGDGEKIRGARFYYLVLDELAQIPEDILNVVIIGMTATKQNPIYNAKLVALQKRLAIEGKSQQEGAENIANELTRNFVIGASTAYYQFNHLFKMLKNHVRIIREKVKGDDLQGELWQMYAVYKLSYKMIPEGFMSLESIAMAKEKMSSMEFNMEYNTIFPSESGGFFPANIVVNAIDYSQKVRYEIVGDTNSAYILFVDAARTSDNCSFGIAKILSTTDSTRFACVCMEVIQGRKFQEAAARVRQVCRRFNIVRIAMDIGGGGLAIKDLLNDSDKCPVGEELFWDMDDPNSFLDKEMKFPKPGKLIIHMVSFTPQWLSEANHGLLSSLERKELVFPTPLGVEDLANKSDKQVEELENAEEEIQHAKGEIINIVMTKTPKGLPHWDTPSNKQRKDRYSAVLGLCQECKEYIRPNVADQEVRVELPSGNWAGKGTSGALSKELGLAGDISDAGVKQRIVSERRKSLITSKKLSEIASLN